VNRLFTPQAIALVGMPGDLSRPGARPFHFLRRHRYRGRIYLVNPGRREIGGVPVSPSLAALPGPVDVAWIGVPASRAVDVVTECGRARIPFAVVLGAGFAEAGESGEVEQQRLREAAAAAGVRLVGPNTVGFVNAWDSVALTFSTVGELDAFVEGPLAILSQSGGVGGSLLNRAVDRGPGVGLFVSTGNEADLTLADYLEWVVADGRARVVACLVEQARAPERLARAVAAAVARGIPVLALKLGGSATGARAARSHTGSLVGGSAAWRAWARAVGLVEVGDPDALLAAATLLARAPRPAGPRAGMLTSSGGIAVLLADALEPRGVRFPPLAAATLERVRGLLPGYATVGNPLDITAGLPEETFGEVMAAMLADPNLDFLVVPLTMATADGGRTRAEQIVWAARGADKPVAVYWPAGSLVRKGLRTLEEARLPLFTTLTDCAAALGAALDFRARCDQPVRPAAPVPFPAGVPPAAGPLPWEDGRRLLAEAGIALAPEVSVTSEAEACRAAERLGFPVVAKLAGALHKTEAGGVRLGLRDRDAVSAASGELLARGQGCVIQPMLEGVEVLVGAVRDPVLGPFVVLAPGGVHAELYRERALRPAPLGPADAEAMLEETPVLAALLAGYRGGAPGDRRALLDTLVALGGLAAALGPRLAEVDLNPVIVGEGGARVVDARIILEGEQVETDRIPSKARTP
jgi:acyl-CoA synthetase (NDP forming)